MREAHMVAAGVVTAGDGSVTDATRATQDAIATLANGAHGYRALADEVESTALRTIFLESAAERTRTTEEVIRAATDSGLDFVPDTDGTVPGAIHRTWLKLETMVAGEDAAAESVVNAEEHAISDLEDALSDDLPEAVAAAIRQAVFDVSNAKARISDWQKESA